MVEQKLENESISAVVMKTLFDSKMRISFSIGIIATLWGLVPFTKQVGQFIERAKSSGPPGYNFPVMADMITALYYMVFFFVTHVIWLKIVPPLLEPIVKVQNDVEDRKRRANKMSLMIYSFIVYSISAVWGYMILKDTEFFPKCLGGHGDIWKTFDDFPFQKEIPGMKEYYMYNLGWHLEGLFKMLILDGLKPDIVEMTLHHIVTIYLVGGSYLINYVNIGSIIEWIHDTTDIFISALRFSSESKYKKATYVLMPLLLITWLYGRIIVFGGIIYVMHTSEVMSHDNGDNYIMNYIVYGVSTILVLNIWWFKVMLNIIHTALTKGKIEDTTTNFQKKDKFKTDEKK